MATDRASGAVPPPVRSRQAVLLIGAPGVGKSCLGRALEAAHKDAPLSGLDARARPMFVSIGDQLREEGLVKGRDHIVTPAECQAIAARAPQLLDVACERAAAEDRVLLLESVKDLEGAYETLEVLSHHGFTVVQVLYQPQSSDLLLVPDDGHSDQARNSERMLAERQADWDLCVGQVLELFSSSMGVLTEVGVAAAPRTIRSLFRQTPTLRDPLSNHSLTAMGLAAAQHAEWLESAGWASDGVWQYSIPQPPWAPREVAVLFKPIKALTSPRLVTQRATRDAVPAAAAKAAGLLHLPMPVPCASVLTEEDADWVAAPGRYAVSHKADGQRCHLIVTADGATYLRNRAGTLYAFPVLASKQRSGEGADQLATTQLPPHTVLDGELLWLGAERFIPSTYDSSRCSTDVIGFFLAFDALMVGGKAVWHLPFAGRLAALQQLGLDQADACKHQCNCPALASAWEAERHQQQQQQLQQQQQQQQQQQAAAGGSCPKAVHVPVALRTKLKAPSPGRDTVLAVIKPHYPVDLEGWQRLMDAQGLFPSDGLVFTPLAAPYTLGMQELLFKWQPREHAAADVSGHRLCGRHPHLIPSLVYECLPYPPAAMEPARLTASGMATPARGRLQAGLTAGARGQAAVRTVSQCWRPVSVRFDKASPNSSKALEQLQTRPTQVTMQGLASAVERAAGVASACARSALDASEPAPPEPCIHPARTMPFPALLALVESAVARGTVERWVDSGGSGLQVLNYRAGAAEGPAESTCRGLVLHPASSTVVATPFVCFKTSSGDQAQQATSGATLARACFKVDGSLVIAFVWQGQVHVATKLRMDSEQAQWAAAWLRSHCPHAVDRGLLQPGWTLMFEAVYQLNRVVVGYPFEGLVLLGAVKPCGREEGEEGLLRLAEGLGVPLAPAVHGTHQELVARLGRGSVAVLEAAQRDGSAEGPSCSWAPFQPLNAISTRPANDLWPMPEDAPPSYEGWVLVSPDGQRTKLVQYAYAWTRHQALTLHPLVVWDRVCTGGLSPEQLGAGLPPHMRAELDSILVALESRYWVAFDELDRCYRHAYGQEARKRDRGARVAEIQDGMTGDASSLGSCRQLRAQSSPGDQGSSSRGARQEINSIRAAADDEALRGALGLLQMPVAHFVPGTLDVALAYAMAKCLPLVLEDELEDELMNELVGERSWPMGLQQSQRPCMFYGPTWRVRHPAMSYWFITGDAAGMLALRGKLLRMVQPATNGHLPGYHPSPACQQTWAKGWGQGPKVGRLAPSSAPPGSYFPIQDLPIPLFTAVLKVLDGESLGRVPAVCKEWARIVAEDRTLVAAVLEAKKANRAATMSDTAYDDSDDSGYDDTYGCSYWDDNDDQDAGYGYSD